MPSGRDSSLFETIQLLNQRKPNQEDIDFSDEAPRSILPVPMQPLSALNAETQSTPRSIFSFPLLQPTTQPPYFENANHHEVPLNIDAEETNSESFNIDDFTNKLLQKCEVLLQDYRSRTNTKATMNIEAPISSHAINQSTPPSIRDQPQQVYLESTLQLRETAEIGVQATSNNTITVEESMPRRDGNKGSDSKTVKFNQSTSTLGDGSTEGSVFLYLSSSDDEEFPSEEIKHKTGYKNKSENNIEISNNLDRSSETAENLDRSNNLYRNFHTEKSLSPDLHESEMKPTEVIDNGKHVQSTYPEATVLPPAPTVATIAAAEVKDEGQQSSSNPRLLNRVDLQLVQPYLNDEVVRQLWKRLCEVENLLQNCIS